jgi:hypothetical protein
MHHLKPNSIDSWEDLKRAFINNFQGSKIRAGTCHDLSQVKQEMNETLRSYIRRFFEMRATIVIMSCSRTIESKVVVRVLREEAILGVADDVLIGTRWADQDDEENDRFPKRNNDKQGNSNNHFEKGQQNNSGNLRKHKPGHEVAAVEHNPRGKKSGSNQAQFEKVLHKQCPMHPKSWQMLFECVSLCKSFNAPPLPQDRKRKDQEDDDEGDKSGAQDFQDPKNVINIIFGGDGGFPSKCA